MRKLSIPYTKDNKILENITTEDLQYIKEIYMPMPYDIMPSGRVYSMKESKIYKEIFDSQIIKAKNMDLTVNVLASKPILGLDEGVNIMSRTLRELERIKPLGVDKVTIGSFTFLKMYGDYLSRLGYKIEVSVLMNIDCIEKFEQLISICPYVTSVCVNNNFINQLDELEYLRNKYKDIDIKILVNHLCLSKCLTHVEHHNLFSNMICDIINTEDMKAWANYSNSKQLLPNCKSCNFINNVESINPVKVSAFLRPNDLYIYDHVIDLFKISGREHPSDEIINSIRAYGKRDYTGNLLSITDIPFVYTKGIINQKFPKEYGYVKSKCQHKCYNCTYCDSILKDVEVPMEQPAEQSQ